MMFKNYQIRSGIEDYTNIKEILQLSKRSFKYEVETEIKLYKYRVDTRVFQMWHFVKKKKLQCKYNSLQGIYI